MTTFCWLPPERLETSWSGPSVTMPSESIVPCVTSACRCGEMKPARPSVRPIVMVVLSATDCERTRPCLWRLFGTQPTPSASAAGTSPARSGRSLIRICPAGVGAEAGHRLGDADPAAAGRAGNAEHLAAAHGEADVGEVVAGEVAHLERDRRALRARPADRVGDAEMHLLAGHRLDQPVLGQVGDRRRDDVAGVAQHRHRLADLVDLLQVVRDEEEGDALRLQLAHAHEQALDLVAVELRRRLVEDDEARAVGERTGDLDQLARLDLEVAGAHVFRHRDVPAVEKLARLPAQRPPADQAALESAVD